MEMAGHVWATQLWIPSLPELVNHLQVRELPKGVGRETDYINGQWLGIGAAISPSVQNLINNCVLTYDQPRKAKHDTQINHEDTPFLTSQLPALPEANNL